MSLITWLVGLLMPTSSTPAESSTPELERLTRVERNLNPIGVDHMHSFDKNGVYKSQRNEDMLCHDGRLWTIVKVIKYKKNQNVKIIIILVFKEKNWRI